MSLPGPETEREIAGAETDHSTETKLPRGERQRELEESKQEPRSEARPEPGEIPGGEGAQGERVETTGGAR